MWVSSDTATDSLAVFGAWGFLLQYRWIASCQSLSLWHHGTASSPVHSVDTVWLHYAVALPLWRQMTSAVDFPLFPVVYVMLCHTHFNFQHSSLVRAKQSWSSAKSSSSESWTGMGTSTGFGTSGSGADGALFISISTWALELHWERSAGPLVSSGSWSGWSWLEWLGDVWWFKLLVVNWFCTGASVLGLIRLSMWLWNWVPPWRGMVDWPNSTLGNSWWDWSPGCHSSTADRDRGCSGAILYSLFPWSYPYCPLIFLNDDLQRPTPVPIGLPFLAPPHDPFPRAYSPGGAGFVRTSDDSLWSTLSQQLLVYLWWQRKLGHISESMGRAQIYYPAGQYGEDHFGHSGISALSQKSGLSWGVLWVAWSM